MVKSKRVTKTFGIPVYLDNGMFFGVVDDLITTKRRISAINVKLSNKILEIAKKFEEISKDGKIALSWSFVKAIDDIVLVSSDILKVGIEHEEE